MPAFVVPATEIDIALVVVSVANLGFSRGATYKEICDRALHIGLHFCPSIVGPQLRLNYVDQCYFAEELYIAMQPILNLKGQPLIFSMLHDPIGRSLSTRYGYPNNYWSANAHFVFVHPG
jgi:hypothetical protein